MLAAPLLVVTRLARAWEGLSIRYVVSGSLASSLYGIPRATQDVDLVAEIELPHVAPLKGLLEGEFSLDAEMIRDAIRRRASFNVVYLATMFKADIFIPRGDAWSNQELSRAGSEAFDTPEGSVTIRFASAEDRLLHKLVRFRLGNEVSDRQWGDILGIRKVQSGLREQHYLDEWAGFLKVDDLLARTRMEPRTPPRVMSAQRPKRGRDQCSGR